jgi:hypothetical protein
MHKKLISLFMSLVWLIATGSASATLIAQWPFDEGAGTTIKDVVGGGGNGTLSGNPLWGAGMSGSALILNGTAQYATIADNAVMELRSSPNYTVAAWVKVQNTAAGVILYKGQGCSAWAGWFLGVGGGEYDAPRQEGNLVFGVRSSNTTAYTSVAAPLMANLWVHAAATFDGTTLTFYTNGQKAGSVAATQPYANTNPFTIGGDTGCSGRNWFTGMIDDFRIYDQALSSTAIIALLQGQGTSSVPSPADGAVDVLRDVNLSWKPGPYAKTHDLYFGTVFNDVNTASRAAPPSLLISQGQDANMYDLPGVLQYGQIYYWRVDEVNAPPTSSTIFKGTTWSFTVEPVAYAMTSANITATASSSYNTSSVPSKTVDGSGLNGDQHSTSSADMWISGKGDPQWIQYQFDGVYKLQQMWVWNSNQSIEPALGFGVKTATVQYSVDGITWTTLSNVPQFAQAPGTSDYVHNTTVSFGGVAAKYVKITPTAAWGPWTQYSLSEVRFFYIPVQAREPKPALGSTGIAPDVTLSWRAGRQAVSHKVYMSTDPNALTLAGTSATNSFTPGGLSLNTKYYWRVDEVNTAEAISTWAGPVWNFTTNPFIVVDDMESYNDTTNQIFNVWVDGYGTTNNGAVVGLATSVNNTFGSTTIFHGGRQSMPLAYTNTGSITNSEATRTFDSIQDWTRSAVKTLTLYFYGQAGNTTTVPFWVRLTDQSNKTAKVIFGAGAGEDPRVLADPAWTTWNIPLSGFTGITLSKIKSMTIGVGNGTGSGTLYVDDISLYPTVTTTTITPTLVGWWKLDNDVKDSSGNNNNGTLKGTPTFVAAGKIGAALSLNGTTDYVDCGNGATLNITDTVTLSAWIKPTDITPTTLQDFIGKGDHAYAIRVSSAQVQFYFYDAATWHQFNSPTYPSTFNGVWHHAAGTFDGVQVRIYVDGVLVRSALYTGGIASATQNVSIGSNTEAAGRLFNGQVDDVRIYHGTLSTSDIVKLANP